MPYNREHRKWLDNKRNTRPWVEAEFRHKFEKAEKMRVREIFRRGQHWIDREVAEDPSVDAREIYIGASPNHAGRYQAQPYRCHDGRGPGAHAEAMEDSRR